MSRIDDNTGTTPLHFSSEFPLRDIEQFPHKGVA